MSDYKSLAKGYAASLRQQAAWIEDSIAADDLDSDELLNAASFIERQQAEIEALKHDIGRHLNILSSYGGLDEK